MPERDVCSPVKTRSPASNNSVGTHPAILLAHSAAHHVVTVAAETLFRCNLRAVLVVCLACLKSLRRLSHEHR
jgi:hypothetical protein